MQEHVIIHTDGGCRGNPGPGSAAYVITDRSGTTIAGKAQFLAKTTNNIAEYSALVNALEAACQLGAESIEVFSDSQLMVRQINGQYKVKNAGLKDLYSTCMGRLAGFVSWRVNHIPRDKNQRADELANRALDMKRDVALSIQSTQGTQGAADARKKIRLGVLLSGGGTTMINIQKQIHAGKLNAEIAIVISSLSNVRGVALAKKMGLETKIVRRKDFSDIEQFSQSIEELLVAAEVDLVVQAGWLCLWHIPEKYESRVMNIHPALLPSFGGQGMWGHHVHEAVLKKGCKVSGCTVHFCTNEYDKGPIIVQRSCPAKDTDDPDTLAARVFQEECIAYPEAIRLYAEGRLFVQGDIVRIRE
ncbi:MAG: phosphoribosylglycinamide formyltransferase [Planctomycetes bacterium]|nr:phosphoribosylglycinamide formyltransferase [Planctomycetota bacterium]